MLHLLVGSDFADGFPRPVLLRQRGAAAIAGKRKQTAGGVGRKRVDFHDLEILGRAATETAASGENTADRCLDRAGDSQS
jgi:hypothetical protein